MKHSSTQMKAIVYYLTHVTAKQHQEQKNLTTVTQSRSK